MAEEWRQVVAWLEAVPPSSSPSPSPPALAPDLLPALARLQALLALRTTARQLYKAHIDAEGSPVPQDVRAQIKAQLDSPSPQVFQPAQALFPPEVHSALAAWRLSVEERLGGQAWDEALRETSSALLPALGGLRREEKEEKKEKREEKKEKEEKEEREDEEEQEEGAPAPPRRARSSSLGRNEPPPPALDSASAYRVRKFFGEERVDPRQVAYAARLEATAPAAHEEGEKRPQPGHVDVKKLQHYFGERPPVALRRQKSEGELVGGEEEEEERLRAAKTMRKVRSILGDAAVLEGAPPQQYREQPEHVRPERLGKRFGEQPALGAGGWHLLEHEGRRVPTVRTADAYTRLLEQQMEAAHRSFELRRRTLDELFERAYDELVAQLQAEFVKLRARAHAELEQQRKGVLDELTALRVALDRAQPYGPEWIRRSEHDQELAALRDRLTKEAGKKEDKA